VIRTCVSLSLLEKEEERDLISLSLWEREGERVLRSPKTLPLFPLPKGKGKNSGEQSLIKDSPQRRRAGGLFWTAAA
jgi:hypothetical protein